MDKALSGVPGLTAVNVNLAAETASVTYLEGEIDRKIAELQSMSITLGDLAAACSGDHRPYDPILPNLARISDG